MKINDTAKGIIVGVLTCGLLGFCTLGIFAFFGNNDIVDFGGIDGIIRYCVPLSAILIITALLGIAIARRAKSLKKVTIALTIILAVLIISGIIYAVSYNLSQPPLTFPPDTI